MSLVVSTDIYLLVIFFFFLWIFDFVIGEPLYANVSKDTRMALLANAENAKSIIFHCPSRLY